MGITMTVKQLRVALRSMPDTAEVRMQISIKGRTSRFLVRDAELTADGEVVLKHA
jgi:hypothetical protein